ITCAGRLELADVAAGLTLTGGKLRWGVPVIFGLMGLLSGASMGTAWQVGEALGLGLLGAILWPLVFRAGARRSLANKSDLERTVTLTFSPACVEVTTVTVESRIKWPAVHRFVEGRKTFILYLGEAMVQVIPKRALRAEDVDALRSMFTSRIVPRKKP